MYGTLRPGEPNWERILGDHSERVVTGRLPGVALLDCGHYPAAVERPGPGSAVGEAVWIRPGSWPAVLAALDHLEGYDPANPASLFVRVLRAVETDEGPVTCWTYLAGPPLLEAPRPEVSGGDWAAHRAGLAGYRDHWEGIAEAGGRANQP